IEIWGSLQSVLVASGNVSKILSPSKECRTRGKLLRDYLNIPYKHILPPIIFRNHFENFDERVEERFNKIPYGVYEDRAMNPSLPPVFDDREQMCQRGYNTFNHTLLFDGKVLDIQALINALKDLINYMKVNNLTL